MVYVDNNLQFLVMCIFVAFGIVLGSYTHIIYKKLELWKMFMIFYKTNLILFPVNELDQIFWPIFN